ncbi:phosphoglycerate mutase, partial [Streptomyces albidoflavus]
MTTPTLRVMLVSPALNPALREARFDGDPPLDPSGARAARTAAPGTCWRSGATSSTRPTA